MWYKKTSHLQSLIQHYKKTILAVCGALVVGIFVGPIFFSGSVAYATPPSSWTEGIIRAIFPEFSHNSTLSAGNSFTSNSTTQHEPSPLHITDNHDQAVIQAVKDASPAVVSIIISKDLPVIEQCPGQNPFSNLPPEFQQFFNVGGGSGSSQFMVPCHKGTKLQEVGGGSGFIVSADGYIVTNKHVVSDTKAEYTVLTNDGKKYPAKVIAIHPTMDFAIIKIEGSNLPTVPLGDSSAIQLGQTAIAIGNALGEFRNTVSVGVVSGLARTVTASSDTGQSETIDNVIQTDAAINPGNSGGPLLDISGNVIGINTAMVSGAQSIGFAIPINVVKNQIAEVRQTGKIQVAYLGVRYVMLTPENAATFNLTATSGALIKGDGQNFAVQQGSPADKAGLKEGDIITAIDGQTLDLNHSLGYVISQKNPGDVIHLTIIREGKQMQLTITLGKKS